MLCYSRLVAVLFVAAHVSMASADPFQISRSSCLSVLTLEKLSAANARLGPQINELLPSFQDLRVAVAIGDKPSGLNLDSEGTHNEVPEVPRPEDGDEVRFHVLVRAEGVGATREIHSLDQSYSLLNTFDGDEAVTELEVNANSFDSLDPLNLYVALSAAPYVERVSLIQTIADPEALSLFRKESAKTTDLARALGKFRATLSRLLDASGFPLDRTATEVEGFRMVEGRFFPTSFAQAQGLRVDYKYKVLDRARRH